MYNLIYRLEKKMIVLVIIHCFDLFHTSYLKYSSSLNEWINVDLKHTNIRIL
jgi:hypothetical protein